MKQKIGYIIVALVIIAVLIYLFINTGNKATAPVTNNDEQQTEIGSNQENPANVNGAAQSPIEVATKNTLAISTQEPGTQITVDNYYLEKPGFIVIHEIKNDLPSTVVGSSGLLKVGPGQDLTFKANLKAGTYFALLYEDNGDKKFNLATDKKLSLFNTQTNQYADRQVVQFTVEE